MFDVLEFLWNVFLFGWWPSSFDWDTTDDSVNVPKKVLVSKKKLKERQVDTSDDGGCNVYVRTGPAGTFKRKK